VIEQTTSSAAAKEGGHFLTAAATPPQLRRRAACLNVADGSKLPMRKSLDKQLRSYVIFGGVH